MKQKTVATPELSNNLHQWLEQILSKPIMRIAALAGDASFRRYYRIKTEQADFILMDAPPPRENVRPFVAVARALKQLGLCVPEIFAEELQQGWLLLSDLGDGLFEQALQQPSKAAGLYRQAMDDLLILQNCEQFELADSQYLLPVFDSILYNKEFQLFEDWYLKKHLNFQLTQESIQILQNIYQTLIHTANAQPQVFVHRDYHSRNLMLWQSRVGILDFQDAVKGPVTYDLVSLLEDCYIDWPRDQVEEWVYYFWQRWCAKQAEQEISFAQFLTWFDWMGVQRHLKCLGIFTRLHWSYQRPHYLQYLPRTLGYILTTCQRYPQLFPLLEILNNAQGGQA